MRRIILFIAVLFMTVPAMAASTVTITCVNDVNMVTVSYDVTGDPCLIRAFGLDIEVDTANITKLEVVDANYRIYPGQIVIVGGEVTDYNTPYAPDDLGDANVTVEMGSLYTWDSNYIGDANAGYGMEPGLSGTLLKFYVDASCHATIRENQARGGIVMEDPDEEPTVSDPLCEVDVDVVEGCECCGDLDRNGLVQSADIVALTNLLDTYGVPTPPPFGPTSIAPTDVANWDPCADVDNNGLMQSADIVAITNWLDTYGVPTPPPFGPTSIACPHAYGNCP